MQTYELQQKILALKQQTGLNILAHSYQAHEIIEIADAVGDSFQLSKTARDCEGDKILLCGVRFMAETAKLLAPEKQVYLSAEEATCPMAEQFTPEEILREKAKHPGCAVVAYINTTAALKAVCDVCVTSSSADRIVRALDAEEILFIPDCNLGDYVRRLVPEKKIHLLQGGCPVHAAVTGEELAHAKQLHPQAEVLVHPECRPEVTQNADFVGATSAILEYARKSEKTEFIIGTEQNIVTALQYDCPDKRFYLLSKKLFCADMRLTTLADVYNMAQAIADGTAEEITLRAEEQGARHAIDEMLRLGG